MGRGGCGDGGEGRRGGDWKGEESVKFVSTQRNR